MKVIVRIGGARDPVRDHAGRVVQRRVHERRAADVDIVPQVLTIVANDPQTVGNGVEIDAEGSPAQRHRQRIDEFGDRGVRVDPVHAPALPTPYKSPSWTRKSMPISALSPPDSPEM